MLRNVVRAGVGVDVLQKVVLLNVLADCGEVQAELGVVVGAVALHSEILGLGGVLLHADLGHLQGRVAAQGVQLGLPVHLDLVFIIQVVIQLLHLPGSVGLGGLRVPGGVGGGVDGVHHGLGHHLVLVVAVFAVQVLGDDHLRLVAADAGHQQAQDVVLAAPEGDGLLDGAHLLVLQVDEVRIVRHAHLPQGVQRLVAAVAVTVGHVDHHGGLFQRRGVVRDGAAQEDQLVVLVGGHHHQIGLVHRRLPLLHVPGQSPGAVDLQIADLLVRAVQPDLDVPGFRQQGQHGVDIREGGGLVPLLEHVHVPVVLDQVVVRGVVEPLDADPPRHLVLGELDAHIGAPVGEGPGGADAAVEHVALVALGHLEGTLLRDVRGLPRRLGPGAQRPGNHQAQRKRQRDPPLPHSPASSNSRTTASCTSRPRRVRRRKPSLISIKPPS